MIALRLTAFAAFVGSYLAFLPATHAEKPPRLVLILGAEHATGIMQEAVSRLRGELAAAGLLTILYPSPAKVLDWPVALEQAVQQQDNAVAAIGIAGGGASELWVHDRSLGRTVVQPLQRQGERARDLAPVVAVRLVEFVRANLASLDLALAPATIPTMPLPVQHHGVGVGAGIHWLDAAGPVSPALAAVLSLVWASRTPWVLELRASGLGPEVEHAAAAGRAHLQHTLLSSQATYRLIQARRFELGAIAGVGAYRGRVSGETAGAPFKDQTMSRWAPSAELGAVGWFWLHNRMCLRFDVTALATLAPVVLRIGSEEIGRTASPALLATLGALAVF